MFNLLSRTASLGDYLGFEQAACEPFLRLFLQTNDFVHDVFALHGEVEAFARVLLLSHGQILLVRGFVPVASEDGEIIFLFSFYWIIIL